MRSKYTKLESRQSLNYLEPRETGALYLVEKIIDPNLQRFPGSFVFMGMPQDPQQPPLSAPGRITIAHEQKASKALAPKNSYALDELETTEIGRLSNQELSAQLSILMLQERQLLAHLIAHLAEFDRRKLYADHGYSSLFVYCTKILCYSEDAACKRITTARIAARFPVVLSALKNGDIHMAAIVLLAPHLTEPNHLNLLEKARGKSKREIEFLVAGLAPRSVTADFVRQISEAPRHPGSQTPVLEASAFPISHSISPEPSAPHIPAAMTQHIEPLSCEHVRIAFTMGRQDWNRVERVRELLRHKCPKGRLEEIFGEILRHYLSCRDPDQKQTNISSAVRKSLKGTRTRRIPKWVRNEVWKRDKGRCTYISSDGVRCQERGGLEFDHIRPWALGGVSDNPMNVRLLCRTHNQLFARRTFGGDAVEQLARMKKDHRDKRSDGIGILDGDGS